MNMESTDWKFKELMREHCDAQLFDDLSKYHDDVCSFLIAMAMVIEKFSADTLKLIEEFLAALPFVQASKYVSEIDYDGNSLMFYCEDINLIECTIKYIHDIHICNHWKFSALMYACNTSSGSFNLNVIKFFLDCGININAKNDRNETALIYLCQDSTNENFEQAIELLIFNGADPFVIASGGLAAYDYVRNKSLLSERLQQLLQGYIRMNNTKRAT